MIDELLLFPFIIPECPLIFFRLINTMFTGLLSQKQYLPCLRERRLGFETHTLLVML